MRHFVAGDFIFALVRAAFQRNQPARRGGGALVFAAGDDEVRVTVARLDVAQAAVQHRAPPVQKHEAFAVVLHHRHLVGAHDHVFPVRDHLADDLAQHVGVQGIESAERLVEHDQRGVVDHGGDQLHLLLIALGQLVGVLRGVLRHAQPIHPFRGGGARVGLSHAAQHGEIHQLLGDRDFHVNTALLRHVAEGERVARDAAAVPRRFALVGGQQTQHHADGGGFASAVGADQAERARRGHFKAQMIHGAHVAVGFGEVPYLQTHGHTPLSDIFSITRRTGRTVHF